MKPVTKYMSTDGITFDTEKECRDHELLFKKVKAIMKPLGPYPKDELCKFANGDGYLQHSPFDVECAKNELVELGSETLHIKKPVSFVFIGRYFYDTGESVLYHAWSRLYSIDGLGREWGQPYYAQNPTEGKQILYTEE